MSVCVFVLVPVAVDKKPPSCLHTDEGHDDEAAFTAGRHDNASSWPFITAAYLWSDGRGIRLLNRSVSF